MASSQTEIAETARVEALAASSIAATARAPRLAVMPSSAQIQTWGSAPAGRGWPAQSAFASQAPAIGLSTSPTTVAVPRARPTNGSGLAGPGG